MTDGLFYRLGRVAATCAAALATAVLVPAHPSAQQNAHLNPVIAKLAAGKTVYGLITGDLSLTNARETARAPVDFVYADLEHNPLDFPALNMFLLGMGDRAAVLKKGSLQPNVALFARFPPEADQSQWVVKQALDIGLMGVIFNGVDSREQALAAVRSMRYPQLKGSKYMEPAGIRGYGTTGATWAWGVSAQEYERHADLWPLNPDGDLLATIMIESVDGLNHLEEIVAVPGVGALFLGAGADLSRSLGVAQNAPEVEAGFQKVLAACKSHNVPCAITAGSASDVVRRVREGWRIIRSTVPSITAARGELGDR
jgi:4-hydroxy-2-oxoheptanedioate aldolase